MNKRIIVICGAMSFAAALSGCFGGTTVVRPVEVDIPIPVPCKSPEVVKPSFGLDRVKVTQGIFDKGKAALSELNERKAYETRLEAALSACR